MIKGHFQDKLCFYNYPVVKTIFDINKKNIYISEKSIPKNYNPISNLSFLSKLYTYYKPFHSIYHEL